MRNILIPRAASRALLASAAALSAMVLAPASAATVDDGSVSTFVNVHSGLCLGVKGNSTAAGALLQSQNCSGSDFQKWRFEKDAANYMQLVNVGSGRCVDVPGATAALASNLQQWGCSGADWQKWNVSDQGGGRFAIISKSNGLALEVYEWNPANGARIVQWTWTGGANQLWTAPGAAVNGGSTSSGPVGFGAGTTGGSGGTVVTVTTPAQLKAAVCATFSNGQCTDTTPRIIRVFGTIDFRGTEGNNTEPGCTYSNNSCAVNGKQEKILNVGSYCSGRTLYNITYDAAGKQPLRVGSNKTLIGVGASSGIKGKGLMLSGGVSNVIIRNLAVTDINDGTIWAGDAITIDNASKVWIDHNHIARIGRQMIVTGWGTAANVTLSNNFFDGTTDYSHYCNGKHYWVMLLVGENQTITLLNNRFHNTAGRSPEVGKQSTASSGGIVHMVNNYYDGNYYMGVRPSDDAVTILEGNYFSKNNTFYPLMQSSTNQVWAPIDTNLSNANSTCTAVLGRACVTNTDTNSPKDFILNAKAMSTIQASSAAVKAIRSVVPKAAATAMDAAVGPQAGISE